MNGKVVYLGGLVLIGVYSYQLLAEIPKYVAERDTVGICLNVLFYILGGGLVALGVLRLAKRTFICGKDHTWVDHPPVYSKRNPEKLVWRAYTNCSICFENKESFDHEEARKKGVCPTCNTRIPWR